MLTKLALFLAAVERHNLLLAHPFSEFLGSLDYVVEITVRSTEFRKEIEDRGFPFPNIPFPEGL